MPLFLEPEGAADGSGTTAPPPRPGSAPLRLDLGFEGWETLFEQAPLGMVLFDRDMKLVRANLALSEMLGSGPEALLGRSMRGITHVEDRARSEEALRRVYSRELTWITIQQRWLREDGSHRWGEFAIRIFWGSGGEFLTGLAIVRDISDTVSAEAALRESEIRNWRITESNMMGLFEWRDAVTISEANDAFLQIIGYTREDLRAGKISWRDILPPGTEDLSLQLREELLSTGRIRPRRFEYQARDGTRIPVLSGGARISWNPVRGIGFVLDMSEQRKTEDERARAEVALRESLAELEQTQARLQVADRLAAMGTLAAGVAHEINNPLGFVMANLGFAQEEIAALRSPDADPMEIEKRLSALAWALGEAQEGATRVRGIVLDLKTFSHPDAELRSAIDVRRVIDSALNLAQGEIRGCARIVRQFQPVPPVMGNEARLSQLFLNLIVNAAQSIFSSRSAGRVGPDGQPAEHEIRLVVDVAPHDRVSAEISDTGVGILPEHLDRIFDPFFTTKPVGLGTGLGLSICHGIVRSLGGEIAVSSTPGAGSAFRVLLPVAPPVVLPTPRAVAVHAPVTPRVRRARILVVDDEPMMGSAISRVLAEHEVVTLTSARVAVERIRSGERFDVVLCDVMMPDLSGMEFHDAVAAMAPELLPRLVFVTGGAYTPDAIDFLERVANPRLEKPILPAELHDAVARVLARSEGGDGQGGATHGGAVG